MIDNRPIAPDEWKYVWLIVATVLFILGVLFKRLSDDLHEKLQKLERQHGLLKPCPFCGHVPDVRNGLFLCKKCRLTMQIPFRNYRNVADMLEQTWNKRWTDG